MLQLPLWTVVASYKRKFTYKSIIWFLLHKNIEIFKADHRSSATIHGLTIGFRE